MTITLFYRESPKTGYKLLHHIPNHEGYIPLVNDRLKIEPEGKTYTVMSKEYHFYMNVLHIFVMDLSYRYKGF